MYVWVYMYVCVCIWQYPSELIRILGKGTSHGRLPLSVNCVSRSVRCCWTPFNEHWFQKWVTVYPRSVPGIRRQFSIEVSSR